MIAIEKTNNTGKLLVAIMAMALIVAGVAVMTSDNVNAAEGDVAEIDGTGYTTLDAAIEAAEEGDVITLTDAAEITKDAPLEGITINCGTYGITAKANITGGKITGTTETNSNNSLVTLGKEVTISGVTFEVSPSGSAMPYAINTAQYSATITGCTFDGNSTFGAIHTNSNSDSVKVSITGGSFGNGMIVYKGCTLEVTDVSINLNVVDLTNSGEVSLKGVDLKGTATIAKTILGWDTSTIPSNMSEYGKSFDLEIDKEIALGEVSKGNATPENEKVNLKYGTNVEPNYDSIDGVGVTDSDGNTVLPGDYIFSENTTISENTTYDGNVTIANDVTVTVASGITLTFGKDCIVFLYGNMAVAGESASAGKIVNNGTIRVLGQESTYPAIEGSGTIDTSAVSENVIIGQNLLTPNTTFGPNQVVTVTGGYLTLTKDTTLTIQGTLIIPEGTVVTVMSGAKMIIEGQAANVQNDGSIIVQGENGFVIGNGAEVVNNGTISAEYLAVAEDNYASKNVITIENGGSVENNGTFTVGIESGITIAGAIVNAEGALIDLDGMLVANNADAPEIVNGGTVEINVTATGTPVISNSVAGATVVIGYYSGPAMQIDDAAFDDSKIVDNAAQTNAFRVVGNSNYSLGGVTIVSMTYDDVVSDENVTYKALNVAGALVTTLDGEAVPETIPASAIGVTFVGKIIVDSEFSTCKGVNFNIGTGSDSAEIIVSGTLSLVNGTKIGKIVDDSSLTVTGTVISVNKNLTDSTDANLANLTVNAASYNVQDSTTNVRTYYYTTLENAIAAEAKQISVTGYIDVENDITVPSGTTITQAAASKIDIAENATLTIADGARLNQATSGYDAASYEGVDVNGTLVIENTRTGYNSGNAKIYSQVSSTDGTNAVYTSLANAMEDATDGTVITIYNKPVSIDKTSFTIKAGVTVVTDGQDFDVNGSVLTIDGTLNINKGSEYTVDNIVENGYTYQASVVLNGYITSDKATQAPTTPSPPAESPHTI